MSSLKLSDVKSHILHSAQQLLSFEEDFLTVTKESTIRHSWHWLGQQMLPTNIDFSLGMERLTSFRSSYLSEFQRVKQPSPRKFVQAGNPICSLCKRSQASLLPQLVSIIHLSILNHLKMELTCTKIPSSSILSCNHMQFQTYRNNPYKHHHHTHVIP